MLLACSLIFAVAASALLSVDQQRKSYPVKRIDGALVVSGKGDDQRWHAAVPLSDFGYPWEDDDPPPTRFRALHNDTWLYCLFEVTDHRIHIDDPDSRDKRAVIKSSRAEIFFRKDENLSPYYCLEIDPSGRVYDYQARYHRQFDPRWSWPQGELVVKTHRDATGYTIEVAISKTSLRALNLLRGDHLEAGVFRADCLPNGKDMPDFKWASWAKPSSPTPDFHIPSAFGVMELQ